MEESVDNTRDALVALLDTADQLGLTTPFDLPREPPRELIHFEILTAAGRDTGR